jgi:hypothetical protein
VKEKNLNVLGLIIMVSLMSATAFAATTYINQTREEEPNNNFAQATQINDNSGILQCMFDSSTDIDVYKFTTTKANTLLTVEAVGNPTVTDTYLEIYNSSATLLDSDDDSGSQTNARINNLNLGPAGTYYIAVTEYFYRSGIGYTYSLTGQIIEPDDTTAPTYSGAPGIISATRTGNGTTADLVWSQANDETSAASAIQYNIHYSTIEANVFSTAAAKSVVGVTTTDITGLVRGNTYYFGVRAEDEAGNIETNTVTVISEPLTAANPGIWTLYE